MLSNETVRKLHEMRLGVMAEAFSAQLADAQFQSVSFADRFAMLVDAAWSARKSNRLTRLIRNAGYADPAACVENIEYHPERRLDREQILRLASCAYLQKAHNSFYFVRYIRLLDLLVEISEARAMPLKRRRLSKLLEKRHLFMGLPQDPWKFYRRCS